MHGYPPNPDTFYTSSQSPMDRGPPFPSPSSSSTPTGPPRVHWERAVSEMKPVIDLLSLYDTTLNYML